MKFLAARVLANAVVGGFCFACAGAVCLGFLGWKVGDALDGAGLGNILNYYHYAADGADLGVAIGALSGVVGAFIFGLAALQSSPIHSSPRFFAPVRALMGRVALGQFLGRVALGQFLGSLSAATDKSFLLYETIDARLHGHRLAQKPCSLGHFLSGSSTAHFGDSPPNALMICGAIAGALWHRRRVVLGRCGNLTNKKANSRHEK